MECEGVLDLAIGHLSPGLCPMRKFPFLTGGHLLDQVLRLRGCGAIDIFYHGEELPRPVRAGIAGAGAVLVGRIAGGNIQRDARVDASVLTFNEIEEPRFLRLYAILSFSCHSGNAHDLYHTCAADTVSNFCCRGSCLRRGFLGVRLLLERRKQQVNKAYN